MNGRRSPRRQRGLREVTKIESYDGFDFALDGRRQHMPVLFLILEQRYQMLKAFNDGLRESRRDFLTPVVRQILRPGWIKLVHLRAIHLVEDRVGPTREVKTWRFRKSQEQIAHT